MKQIPAQQPLPCSRVQKRKITRSVEQWWEEEKPLSYCWSKRSSGLILISIEDKQGSARREGSVLVKTEPIFFY